MAAGACKKTMAFDNGRNQLRPHSPVTSRPSRRPLPRVPYNKEQRAYAAACRPQYIGKDLMKSRSYPTSSSSALSVSSTVFLARFFMSLHSDIPSTDTMFADTVRAPFVNDLLFSRRKSYAGARSAFRYAVVNSRMKLCVTI